MTRRRLVLYLLLNAFVSMLVSGAILFFYDRANQKTDCGTSGMIPTLASVSINTEILSVAGAGVLSSEVVIVQNDGDSALLMTGWTLKDNQGSIFTFPQLTIYPGGTVQIHTGPGTDSSADLYWRLPAPVWKSGALVSLYDAQNVARSFYRIP